MAANFQLPSNEIGIDPEHLREASLPSRGTRGGHHPKKVKQPEVTPDSIRDALADEWNVHMKDEAGMLQAATRRPFKVALECGTIANLKRVRLRLYRAKRMLLDTGNRYVGSLIFRVVKETIIVIEMHQGLEQFQITDEEELAKL